MNLRPLHDKIIIKRFETETKTSGGIILPNSAQEKQVKGKVLAIGKKVFEVKVNDEVLFHQWNHNEIKVGKEELILIKESDIIAILD